MAYKLPMDLIQQVQRATRAEAGLSHYDPTQTLPPLPSISETVASFDPSPPYLRCKNCKGRLLRGVQSVLCVYCGRPNDVVHDPICFKDTVAYRWLLESLHLDGSETVGPLLEKGDSNRGRSTPKDGVQLSDLLDFRLGWPAEEEKRENNSSSEKPERSYLNFSGIDLDNFFYESRRLDTSSKPDKHQVKRNDVVTAEIKAVATDNHSFSENVPSSESAVQSYKDKDNQAFSEWEADFQSANAGDQFDGSKSFDPRVDSAVAPGNVNEISEQPDPLGGSPVDFSSHLDTVFGSAKELNDAKLKDNSAASPPVGDWTSDDMWSNFNSGASPETKQPDVTVTVNDALPQDNMNNVDLSYQLDSIFGPQKDSKDGKEKDDSTSFSSIGDWTSDSLWDNLSSEASSQMKPPDVTVKLTDALPQVETSNHSTSLDWFEVDNWQNNTSAPANVMSRDNVSIGDWDDFTSSIPVQDSSDIAASESTSEVHLFTSENNLEEIDFGSFSQADTLPSSANKESVPTELNNIGLEVAVSDRVTNAKSDTHEGVIQPDTSGDVNNMSTQAREDVEMLLSQMHDLSFMLEDKLSLPSKS